MAMVLFLQFESATSCDCNLGLVLGIVERGVPQAYVRARASSATMFSVHILGVFSVFSVSKRDSETYQNGLDTYLLRIQTRTPCMIFLRFPLAMESH